MRTITDEQKIKVILDRFMFLTNGVRVLMLHKRSKDFHQIGLGTRPDKKATKKISKNKDEFIEILLEFLKIIKDDERIYCSVNERDMKKAIKHFKQKQLDVDYLSEEDRNYFYIDIKNRWISSLMKPTSKKTSNFLIDIDNGEKPDYETVLKDLSENNIKIISTYPTKNGFHIITEPFQYPKITPYFKKEGCRGKIKIDGLALLYY